MLGKKIMGSSIVYWVIWLITKFPVRWIFVHDDCLLAIYHFLLFWMIVFELKYARIRHRSLRVVDDTRTLIILDYQFSQFQIATTAFLQYKYFSSCFRKSHCNRASPYSRICNDSIN